MSLFVVAFVFVDFVGIHSSWPLQRVRTVSGMQGMAVLTDVRGGSQTKMYGYAVLVLVFMIWIASSIGGTPSPRSAYASLGDAWY